MAWKKVNNSDAGDATHFGGNDMDKISDFLSGVVDVDSADVNSQFRVRDNKFKLRNPANTFDYIFRTAAIGADREISLPLMTGNDELVLKALATILTNKTINMADNSITSTSAVAGSMAYHNGTKFTHTAGGTQGQIMTLGGGNVPAWSNLSAVSNSGTATIKNGEYSVKVTHNLGTTPSPRDIIISPTNRAARGLDWWVSDITSSTFILHVNDTPSAWQRVEPVELRVNLYHFDSSLYDYTVLQQLKADFPTVPMSITFNWSSGPGASFQSGRQTVINAMKAAGFKTHGYVPTGYGATSTSTVNANTANWDSWYEPDGIMFDEWEYRSTELADVPTYQSHVDYAKSLGFKTTMGNPGTDSVEDFAKIPDQLILSEQATLPGIGRYTGTETNGVNPSGSTWKMKYGKSRWGLDQHTANIIDTDALKAYIPYLGFINIQTHNVSPNAWNDISSQVYELAYFLHRTAERNWQIAQDYTFEYAIIKR